VNQVNLVPRYRTVWEEGRETGREVVALGAAIALTALVLDVTLTDEIGRVFDIAFVALCLVLAVVVHRLDFFVVGVLPPLLMGGVFVLVAISDPGRLGDPADGVVQATISGLSHHSMALLAGYGLCLLVLFLRQRVLAARERD
jgi:hypothetical protein